MEKLMNFIQMLIAEKEFELVGSHLINDLHARTEEFIYNNFPKIRQQKYVHFEYDFRDRMIKCDVSKEFAAELDIHYPEYLV